MAQTLHTIISHSPTLHVLTKEMLNKYGSNGMQDALSDTLTLKQAVAPNILIPHLPTLHVQMMEMLNKYGGNGTRKPLPGEPLPVNHKTKKGQTPLMVAVQAGHQEAMQYMLAVSSLDLG